LIAVISISWPDTAMTSPMDLPISALATGEAKEIVPALGSASSSPTMRYFWMRPSPQLKMTVLPKVTESFDEGAAITCAVRSLAAK
jgi:hypothetical protein